jgi:hypothetical protein
MQFRYTALRGLLANAVAAGLCVWLVLEGFALWALVLSQIANLRGDGGLGPRGALAAGAGRVRRRRCASCGSSAFTPWAAAS